MADDRIKREIEDILSRLDDLPAEREPIPFRKRSSPQPGSLGRGLIETLTHISIRHVMLTALVLLIVGFFMRGAWAFGQWMLIAGLVLFVSGFVISFFNRGAAPGSTRSPRSEKRWRGQPMDLEPPTRTLSQRLRAWLGRKSRP